MARETWTDERLDELNHRVNEGFKETRTEIREEFRAVRMELAAQTTMLNQTMYRLFGGMLVAWVVGIVAILAQT